MPTRAWGKPAKDEGTKPTSARARRLLTDRDIKALRLGETVYGHLPHLPGTLVARARPSGKTFFYRYRNKIDGGRYIQLGAYDERGGRHGLGRDDQCARAQQV